MRKLARTQEQHEEVDHDIRRVINELIQDELWEAAEKVASTALPEVDSDEEEPIRAYKWIAIKNLHGTSAIQAEVGQWDCSEGHLKILKRILLDDPEAMEFARGLAESGAVNVGVIRAWPVICLS